MAATEVGRKLRVGWVLEGSIRRSGKRIRLTAELVNTANGYQAWAERYDRVMEDVFDIQDEITTAIVDQLSVKLVGKPKRRLVERQTTDTEAYNLYLKGLFHTHQQVPEASLKAAQYFEQAIERDPGYAPALAGLAFCYGTIAFSGGRRPVEIMPKAKQAALQAVRLDESLAEAHAVLGFCAALYDYDFPTAEPEFRRALELKPDYALARHWYALLVLMPMKRWDEAEVESKRAQQLDPPYPSRECRPAESPLLPWTLRRNDR